MTSRPATDDRLEQQRARVFAGLEEVLRRTSFRDVTVADIVAAAGTSKRTFYELYPHKTACLVDHYRRTSERIGQEVLAAVEVAPDRLSAIRAALEAFYRPQAENPGMARTHLFELYGVGEEGMLVRQRTREAFADLLVELAARRDGDVPGVRLDLTTARGLVGAVSDLAVRAVLDGRTHDLTAEIDAGIRIVRSVIADLATEQHGGRHVPDGG